MTFEPTHADIVRVRALLLHVGIVADLIDDILDHAEYWLHSTSQAKIDVEIPAKLAPGLSEEYHGNKFLLRSYPVGLTNPIGEPGLDTIAYRRGAIEPRPMTQASDRIYFERSVPYPVPQLDHPARKVVFRFKSHDQGWTTHSTKGAFHDACTWFDVGIERFEANHICGSCADDDLTGHPPLCKLRPIEPPPVPSKKERRLPFGHRHEYQLRERFNKWEIQRNRVAENIWTDYEVTWMSRDNVAADSPEAQELFKQGKNPNGYDGKFVRSLRLGDVVTVWGRSVQAGWRNFIHSVEIDVYWAV